jgi:hypothetical protein
MRRASIFAFCLLVAAIGAGCGGSGSSGANSSASSKDEAAITNTYNTYVEAVKRGDGKTACQQLTPAYQRRASKLVTPSKQAKLKGASCAQAISQGTLRGPLQKFEPSLERIRVYGDRASGFQPGEGALGPQKVIFKRLGGDWLIDLTIYQKGVPATG